MRQRRSAAETPQPEDPDLQLPPHGTAPPPTDARMACPGCSTPVPPTELAQFGNRCSSCYAAFCRATTHVRRPIADKRDPLGWARAVVALHRDGGNVTPAQLQMAQDALRSRFASFEDDDADR